MNGPLLEKSLDFAVKVVLLHEEFSRQKRDLSVVRQLLRSGTSVGANLNEAVFGSSKADFIAKLHISLKEISESIFWLKVLDRTQLVRYDYSEMTALAEEIKRMLIASLNTAKSSAKAENV